MSRARGRGAISTDGELRQRCASSPLEPHDAPMLWCEPSRRPVLSSASKRGVRRGRPRRPSTRRQGCPDACPAPGLATAPYARPVRGAAGLEVATRRRAPPRSRAARSTESRLRAAATASELRKPASRAPAPARERRTAGAALASCRARGGQRARAAAAAWRRRAPAPPRQPTGARDGRRCRVQRVDARRAAAVHRRGPARRESGCHPREMQSFHKSSNSRDLPLRGSVVWSRVASVVTRRTP